MSLQRTIVLFCHRAYYPVVKLLDSSILNMDDAFETTIIKVTYTQTTARRDVDATTRQARTFVYIELKTYSRHVRYEIFLQTL